MELKVDEWNESYKRGDNFVFYPHEDIIRFISKYIKKRIGYDSYVNVKEYTTIPKVLDFGCGIGRHVKLLDEFCLDAYGFDLSDEAIQNAKELYEKQNLNHLVNKVIVANIINLPYKSNNFDFMLSHGVLDSMPYDIAKSGLKELHRCLKKDGYMYFDLISSEDSSFNGNYNRLVKDSHEQGTIQSYYDMNMITSLINDLFVIDEIILNNKINVKTNHTISRYHIVVKKL